MSRYEDAEPPRASDIVLAAAIWAPVGVAAVVPGRFAGSDAWSPALILIVASGSMFIRRRRPLLAASITAIAYVVAVQFGGFNGPAKASDFSNAAVVGSGIAVAALSYALGTSRHLGRSIAGVLILTGSLEWGDVNPFPAMITVGLWLVGRVVLSHRTIAQHLRIRAFELESERERFIDEAVRHEHGRIARDLHDIIAHCVSIMVIQASAGQRLAAADTVASDELLDNIAIIAREADTDIAGLSQLLDAPADPGPPISRRRFDELIARATNTGVRLDCRVVGDIDLIPGPAGSITYRVLQEGLTNALKHAPGAAITIDLRYGEDLPSIGPVRVDIINRPAHAGPTDLSTLGSGHGLVGLRERAHSVGGTVEGGPTSTGGWHLRAVLPART
jgi:signal transduction histidine kinase